MSKSSPGNPLALSTSSELGRRGEELAAAYLQQSGFRIVASNFTIPVGRNRNDAVVSVEIDLVAYEGPMLCFVEVKTRASDRFAVPSANVDLRKRRQIVRAARAYRRMFGLSDTPYRYDVVSIVWPPTEDIIAPTTEEDPGLIGRTVSRQSESLQIDILRNFWSEELFRKRHWPGPYWD